jgi:hypothetical protein
MGGLGGDAIGVGNNDDLDLVNELDLKQRGLRPAPDPRPAPDATSCGEGAAGFFEAERGPVRGDDMHCGGQRIFGQVGLIERHRRQVEP